MTQAALGEAAGLSMQTVRAYERRRRHPTRPHLLAMLDALGVERGERNTILASAGFAGDRHGPPFGGGDHVAFSPTEAAKEIARYQWPAFVTNEHATILAANRAAQALWSLNVSAKRADDAERNLLTVMMTSSLVDCVVNWDEVLTCVISVIKGSRPGGENIDDPSPQFRLVLNRVLAAHAADVARFQDLWHAAPNPPAKTRWSYPIVWRHDDGTVLRFHCFTNAANEADRLAFHDWIPLDGVTWAAVDNVEP